MSLFTHICWLLMLHPIVYLQAAYVKSTNKPDKRPDRPRIYDECYFYVDNKLHRGCPASTSSTPCICNTEPEHNKAQPDNYNRPDNEPYDYDKRKVPIDGGHEKSPDDYGGHEKVPDDHGGYKERPDDDGGHDKGPDDNGRHKKRPDYYDGYTEEPDYFNGYEGPDDSSGQNDYDYLTTKMTTKKRRNRSNKKKKRKHKHHHKHEHHHHYHHPPKKSWWQSITSIFHGKK